MSHSTTSSELGVLGAMLSHERAAEIAVQMLKDEQFSDPFHRECFRQFRSQFEKYGFVDRMLAEDALMKSHYALSLKNDFLGKLTEIPDAANIERYCRIVCEDDEKRRYVTIGKRLAELGGNGVSPAEIRTYLDEQVAKLGNNGSTPGIMSAGELFADPPARPAELIRGVAYAGSKISFSAPSKARKTWLQMHLGFCLAAGIPWYGFEVNQGRVLYVNLELGQWPLYSRLKRLSERLNEGNVPEAFDVLQLRGHCWSAERLRRQIVSLAKPDVYSLIIIDPLYKVMGDREENAASGMGPVLGELERLSSELGSALLLAHHFTKGNAAGKSTLDRASGSGVYARDGDAILTLTPHEADPDTCFTLEFVLRDFAPVEPVVLRWDYPVFEADERLVPCAHAEPRRRRKWSYADVQEAAGHGLSYRELARAVMAKCNISERTAERAVDECTQRRFLVNYHGLYKAHVQESN